MTILKKGCSLVLSFLVAGLMVCSHPVRVSAETAALAEPVSYTHEELLDLIEETYEGAKKATGYRGFNGRCSSMVNGSVVALGIHEISNRGNGSDIYDRYKDIGRTSGGYDVVCYDRADYTLEEALWAVSEDGTRDVYNLIVGWDGGVTGASSAYGHACFVHGIVDGNVYFSESFGLELLNGDSYRQGEPIVCSVEEFAAFYDKWAYFEGLIHFDVPDESAPRITDKALRLVSGDGFTLSFRVEDDQRLGAVWAKVWTTGQTEDTAWELPVTLYDGAAGLRVDAADFGGACGEYFVRLYAMDRKGNLSCSELLCLRLDLLAVERGTSPADPVMARGSVPADGEEELLSWQELPDALRQAHIRFHRNDESWK